MPSIKIKIGGIGICYEKGDYWNVLFPFNEHHRVLLKTSLGIQIPLAAPRRVIEIAAEHGPSAPSGSLNQLIDLTEKPSGSNPGLHKDGIRLKENWQTSGVLLKVKFGIFHQGDRLKSRYLLTKGGVDHRPAANFGYSADIILTGRAFSIAISDLGGVPLPIPDSEIEFDNACPNCTASDNADFDMVYRVIEDAAVAGNKFALKRHPEDARKRSFLEEAFRGNPKMINLLETFTNNPEPGVAGLPCNLVGASDSSRLP